MGEIAKQRKEKTLETQERNADEIEKQRKEHRKRAKQRKEKTQKKIEKCVSNVGMQIHELHTPILILMQDLELV